MKTKIQTDERIIKVELTILSDGMLSEWNERRRWQQLIENVTTEFGTWRTEPTIEDVKATEAK